MSTGFFRSSHALLLYKRFCPPIKPSKLILTNHYVRRRLILKRWTEQQSELRVEQQSELWTELQSEQQPEQQPEQQSEQQHEQQQLASFPASPASASEHHQR